MSTTANMLMGLPMGVIAAAYWGATGQASTNSKTQMVAALAALIDKGSISMADVRRLGNRSAPPTPAQAQQVRPQPAPANDALRQVQMEAAKTASDLRTLDNTVSTMGRDISGLDQRLGNLGQQQASMSARVAQLGTDIANLGGKMDAQAQAAAAEAKSLRAQVQTLADTVGRVNVPVDELRAAMRQAIDDAWAPIRIAAEANGTQAQVQAQVAGPVGRASALDVFGIDARDARGRPLMFSTWGHADAPPVDSCHIWTEGTLRFLALAEATGRNIWLAGPAGVGKTQTAEQWAARSGRMFRRFVFTRYATADDFLGATGLKDGSTEFAPGPVLDAFRTPGAICLLDEPATGNPAAMSVLNGLLEGAAKIAYGPQVWHRGAGMVFLGADNSNGQGDSGGRFAGVQAMNTAFMDRFAFVVPCTYLNPTAEAEALRRHTGCTQAMADHVIAAFTVARSKVEAGDLIDPPTFRQAIAFTQACSVLPVTQAWATTVAARQPAESQVALAQVFSACIDEALIQGEAA